MLGDLAMCKSRANKGDPDDLDSCYRFLKKTIVVLETQGARKSSLSIYICISVTFTCDGKSPLAILTRLSRQKSCV